jgi:hypothetical protein
LTAFSYLKTTTEEQRESEIEGEGHMEVEWETETPPASMLESRPLLVVACGDILSSFLQA